MLKTESNNSSFLPFFLKTACILFAVLIAFFFSSVYFITAAVPTNSSDGSNYVYLQNDLPEYKSFEVQAITPELEKYFEMQAAEANVKQETLPEIINPTETTTELTTTSTQPPPEKTREFSIPQTTVPPSSAATKSPSTGSIASSPPSAREPGRTVTATNLTATASSAQIKSIVFTTYGFGHGVGMSQQGAMAMARAGRTYAEILLHYYPGCAIAVDANPPAVVRYGGVDYNLTDYLARTAEAEIGRSAAAEAFKAQVAAAYTYAKQRNFANLGPAAHALSSNTPSSGSLNRVRDVLGMASENSKPRPPVLTINGRIAFAPYFASSAGQTTDVTSVWGGSISTHPHLRGAISSPEEVSIRSKSFTLEEFRGFVDAYNKKNPSKAIILGSNPQKWISILSHDGTVNKNAGYIKQIQVGNRVMSGYAFRFELMGLAIRSHCFTLNFA